jgi:hypothetical protein
MIRFNTGYVKFFYPSGHPDITRKGEEVEIKRHRLIQYEILSARYAASYVILPGRL